MINGFSISLMAKAHDRSSFSCGIESLDNYLKKQAGQDAKRKVAVTYVLEEEETKRVVGYYTLSATAIALEALPDSIRKKLPKHPYLPATLIGRLAIDDSFKGKRFGEIILLDAMKRAHIASKEIASFSIVVDAINEAAEKFYKKYGFLDLTSPDKRLIFVMNSAGFR